MSPSSSNNGCSVGFTETGRPDHSNRHPALLTPMASTWALYRLTAELHGETRNDILAREREPETKEGVCKILTRTLNDPYTGKIINFVRGNDASMAVQIDHVVALMNAWDTGAQQLTAAQRISLANDPMNLFAVDGPTNSQKGAGDAATWLHRRSPSVASTSHIRSR